MKLFLFNNDEKLIGTVSPLEGIQNEEINKIQTIECTVVYSELIEKASYIGHKDYSDNRIFHLYKIDHVTKTSTTDVKIVGVHTFFDDMESDGYVKDFRPTNRELVGVLTTILDGSRWQLGTVNIQRRYTGNFYYVTRKEAISKLIEATQIEIKPRLEFSRGKITGRYLDVFTRLGGRNGKVFVHGRDLLTVSEKKSQGAIYTAVVGRGKGEETDTGGYGRRISFKDVEWRRTSGQPVDKPVGQEYVEIPAMTKLYGFEKGTKPRIKIVEFQDETDKEKLLRLSYEWLEKNSRMQVEYSAKVLNVGNLELGDTVGIFNPKLGIKYETRVFKVKRNLVNNKLTEFGIGDKVTTSPFSRTIELAKEMKNFQDDTVYWLDKIRERLSDKLINEDGYNYDLKADNEYKVPAGYYSFDKPIDQNPTKVVYTGAGKIAIANSKKPTGEWNWKTFLDGRGATLDLINTGVLRAGRIQSADGRSYWDLDTGEFHMEQSAINEAVKTAVSGKVQEIVGEVKKNLPTKEELKGKSSYLHKKYSDYPDGRNMSDNSNLKYIGIYTGDKQQAPTNASEYSWTKIRGEDGARGRDGNNGRDGVSNYIHRKYSDNANGSPMSDNSNLKYIGIYTGTSATAPTTPTSYTWSKIKGEDGAQGVPGARGSDGRTSYLHTAYSNSATGDRDFSTTNSINKEYIGTYTDFEINDSNDYRRYKWVKIKGENGRDGNNGRDGVDGKSINENLLPNSNFAFDFKNWEDKLTNSGLNYNFDHARTNFGRGLHIWGTPNADYKGFSSVPFNLIAKQGDKLTLSMDLGKDALTQNAPLRLALHYIDDKDTIVGQEWKTLDLATQNFEVKKYKRISMVFTVQKDIRKCRVMVYATVRQLINFYIDNIKLERGEVATEWSPAYEDLKGHTLTANLWFSGNYINNVTKNVRLNLVLFYDGKEVRDFTTNVSYTNGIDKGWRSQENLRTLGGTIDYGFWGDGEKNGEALSAIAIVNYKGLEIVSTARLDNVPNVEDVKETIKKFKTFESTLDNFKSVIGEIKGKEIKTIVNTPNLCIEDFSNNKTKSGNDLYFNVSPNLKANTKYTIIVHAVTKVPDTHQKTRVYGAKSGGGEQWLKSGLNVWVVDYATEQTRVNIYQLGNSSEVTKVEIYEGDYKEYIDKNNRFTSLGALTNHTSFYSYRINHNIPVAKGKFYLVQFDLATLPDNRWFSAGDGGIKLSYDWDFKKLNEELKLKDNEYIFEAFYNEEFYIFHSTNSLKITNVRLYEVRFGVTLATQSSLIDISSMIDQSKEAVTLSARKEIEGKLTNYPTNAYLSNNFANKQDLENLVSKSELKVLSDRIESSVNTGNFGTTLSQNAYYVKVAWNGISNYVQFENGGLNFYEGDNTQNNLRARIDDGNYTFWRDGYNLGNMGTGYYKFDPQKKGIQFHLEYDGWFMGWAYKQKRTDNFYTWKWYYTSGSVGDTYADTLNAGCNTNFRWNEIWYFKTKTSWFNITDGLNGTISVVSNIENTGDGGIRWWTRNLTFKNGILIGG